MAKIATIRGIALAPGVSKNGRLYTAENIRDAVQRARARIASGQLLTMLTHHGADDDSTHIVGRVTAMGQDSAGRATFEAQLAPTANGRVIKKLVKSTGGQQPFLKGVSIRGRWQGNVRTVNGAETAPGLEIEGLDFTHKPGVADAQILAESAGGKAGGLIFESAEEVVVTKSTARLVAVAETAFNAETAALRALSEAELNGRMAASLAARRPVTETSAAPSVPAAAPEATDLHLMNQEQFEAAAAGYVAGKLAVIDAQRPRSPFWRGLDGPPGA